MTLRGQHNMPYLLNIILWRFLPEIRFQTKNAYLKTVLDKTLQKGANIYNLLIR